jgi:hypothetical protein
VAAGRTALWELVPAAVAAGLVDARIANNPNTTAPPEMTTRLSSPIFFMGISLLRHLFGDKLDRGGFVGVVCKLDDLITPSLPCSYQLTGPPRLLDSRRLASLPGMAKAVNDGSYHVPYIQQLTPFLAGSASGAAGHQKTPVPLPYLSEAVVRSISFRQYG